MARDLPIRIGFGLLLSLSAMNAAEADDSKLLLLDSRLIEQVRGARLTVGQVEKHSGDPLFSADRPWEQRLDNVYANVIFDEDAKLFKCWYSPFIFDGAIENTPRDQRDRVTYVEAWRKTTKPREMGLCYATSADGIVWKKPSLRLYEYKGSLDNNLTLRIPPEGPHGTGVFRDERETDSRRRYKAFFSMNGGLWLSCSPDGLAWDAATRCEGTEVAGDTHNNLLWSSARQRYVAFTRTWGDGIRQVARTETVDLRAWTKPQVVLQGEDARHQTYAMLVFHYAQVYLGLLMIFDTTSDRIHCELAWSPDTIEWHRVSPGTPLIANGPPDSYDFGCVFAAAYPILQAGRILLYYGGSNGPHGNWRDSFLCRAELPIDRWAGYAPESTDAPGHLVTRPLLCTGGTLHVNADAQGGALRVSVLDENGVMLAESEPIHTNVTDGAVRWTTGNNLAALVDRTIQFHFELDRSRLYAIRFARTP